MADPCPSIGLENLAGGLSLHIFHSTVRELNAAGKSFAQRLFGAKQWFALSKIALSKDGLKGLKDNHAESDRGLRWAKGFIWDTYDMVNLLRWVVSCSARKPTSVDEKEKILLLHRNLEDARMLRLWLSHGQLPPLGRFLGSLAAYATVLEAVGCSEETVQKVRKLSMDLRKAILPAETHPGCHSSVADFPTECVHGAVVLSAFFHLEKSLEHVCEKLDHIQLAACRARRKLSRPMELKDFLMFVQGQVKDTFKTLDKDFSKGFVDFMVKYRNHLFHDRQLPLIEKTLAFWEQSNKALDLLCGDAASQGTKETTDMLNRTSVWLKDKHAPPPCCIEEMSDGRGLSNWIVGPTDILEGRNAEVELIVGSMTPGKPIWIYGPSGIGKTHLASSVASRLRKIHSVQHFFQSTSQQTLAASISQFAVSNGIEIQNVGEKFDDLIAYISCYLRESKAPMLLLFDDVKDAQLVAPLISAQQHHVVITSLSDPPAENVFQVQAIRLGPLSTVDSLKVMVNVQQGAKSATRRSHWPDIDDGEAWLSSLGIETTPEAIHNQFSLLKNLLETTLCNLPLAVSMAGHLVAKRIPVKKIADSLADVAASTASGTPRIVEMQEAAGHAAHALAVSGLGYLALAQLEENSPAHFLAFVVACTANPSVSLFLLEGIMQSEGDAITPTNTLEMLRQLQNVGILEITNDKAVRIHPLMQGFLVDILLTERRFFRLLLSVVFSLASYFPDQLEANSSTNGAADTDKKSTALCAGQFARISAVFLRSGLSSFLEQTDVRENDAFMDVLEDFHSSLGKYHLDIFKNQPTDPQVAKTQVEIALDICIMKHGPSHTKVGDLNHQLAMALITLGDVREAKKFFLRALSVFEQHFGHNHVELADTIHNLGNIALNLGDAHEAKELFLQALSIKEQHFGHNHVELADTINNLGNVALNLGDAREAKEFYLQALSIKEQHFGHNHVELADTIHNLGLVASNLGDAREAKELFLRAFSIKEQHFGQKHVELANTINNLGNVALNLGDAREAKEFYLRALSIYKQHFGDNHVELAPTIHNLGNVAADLGDAREAKELFLRALSIKEQHFGHNHVELANTINNLGNVALNLGDAREAKEFYLRALSIYKLHFGHNHVKLADTINNLGNVAADLGDAREAKELHLRALSIEEQHFGHNHVKLASTINNLGNVASDLGDAREAKEFYLRALSIFEQHFGHNHVKLASTIYNLGNVASNLGNAREAKEFYLRALSIFEQHFGHNHVELADTIHNLGNVASDIGDAREAKEFYLRALSIFEQHFGHNHVELADTIHNLGNVASDLGDAREAKEFYLRALSIKEQHFGHNHVELADTIHNLGNVASDLGDAREAKEFYLRALSIKEQHFGHNHVELADTIHNLGNVASDLGDAREAKKFYLRALSIKEQHFGHNHVELADTIHNLGNVASDLGDAREAKKFYLQALSIKEQHFGHNHVELADTIHNLGNVSLNLGDAREAKEFYLRALSIKEQHFGHNHVELADTIHNLGNVASDLGDAREAKKFYLRALSIKEQHFGHNHVELADTIHNLGNVASDLGDAREAKKFYLQALSIKEQHFGHNHVELADTIHNLGNVSLNLGDAREAKEFYLRALSIKEQHFGHNHVELADTIHNLGNVASDLGDAREAKKFYLQALSIKEQHFGHNHVELADTIHNLGNVSLNLGDAREAKEFYLRALSIKEQHFGHNHVELADTIHNLGNVASDLSDARELQKQRNSISEPSQSRNSTLDTTM